MTIKEYSFDLPEHLIAQTPIDRRGEDRLLVLDKHSGTIIDEQMTHFASYLQEGSILVVNNSKVRKARVFAISETKSRVEFLFLEENLDHSWNVMVTKTKNNMSASIIHSVLPTRAMYVPDALLKPMRMGQEPSPSIMYLMRIFSSSSVMSHSPHTSSVRIALPTRIGIRQFMHKRKGR